MRPQRIVLLLLIIGLVFPACKKDSFPEKRLFRFIDRMTMENVAQSPLAKMSGETGMSNKIYPLKSYPVADLGTGENPYGIKRKLNIRNADSNILFAPPESRYVFDIVIPAGSVLDFGTGIVRDRNSQEILETRTQEEPACTFTLLLEVEGERKTLFQKTHSFPKKDQSMVFQTHEIDLSGSPGRARLTFVTEAPHPHFSFWSNPVLYKKGSTGNNIILISLDTLRADHLGCYGYERETSPAIDTLAEDSALFLNTYSSSPWTLSSHVSLLTSLNPMRHGVHYENEKMDSSLVTLADLLRQEGFACSAFTGGGFVNSVYGFSKGFDSYGQSSRGIRQKDSAEWICASVLDWIDDHRDRDFFLFIHTYQPHNPFSSPPPFNSFFLDEDDRWDEIDMLEYVGGKKGIFKKLPDRERRNIVNLYDGEIRYTDAKLIGPLMERLKELGIYDTSLIILTSDHGEEFYDHNGWEHGHTLYDELLKVPLIIKLPESQFAKTRIPTIVRLIDVMPTILDEQGISVSGLDLDGKSLVPVLRGKEVADRRFVAYKADNILDSHVPQKLSVNEERNKLILNRSFTAQQLDFFAFPPPEPVPVELYDLSESPAEKKNIVDEKPRIASRLVQLINDLYAKIKEGKSEKADIDKELLEQLRALGYLR
jgi:arylsulfatase A-like enzyme